MIVRAAGLDVSYGATRAVVGVDLVATPGCILGVAGPNGSGKSSLVKAIAGIVKSTGQIRFDDSPARPGAIAYMAQDISGQASLTVLEVVLLGRLRQLCMRVGKADIAAAEEVLAALDLTRLAGRYLGELSGGQRQIVFLAQALVADPKVLLLDEPISALDLRHQIEVLDLVRRLTSARRLTTICVLHDLNATSRIADRVMLMRCGRLVADGRPREVITPDNLARVFEVEAEVTTLGDGVPIVRPLRARHRQD